MENIKILPRYRVKSNGMSQKKTQSEYIYDLSIKNPNIEVIDEYIDSKTKIKHFCKIHNEEFYIRPTSALNGSGCKKCHSERISKKAKWSHDEYVQKVLIQNPNIEVIGKYENSRIPFLHRCIKHNIIWNVTPMSILRGSGCKLCRNEKIGKKNKKSHSQYIDELKLFNPNVEAIEEYKNASIPILHKCLINDNHKQWYALPGNVLAGSGCPECCKSRGEKEIRLWLDNHKINYTIQKRFSDCFDSKPLPFDFYIEDMNLCIEYDGKQHFEAVDRFGGEERFKKQQRHDEIKTDYCKEHDISLLRISYKQNIEEELNKFLFI